MRMAKHTMSTQWYRVKGKQHKRIDTNEKIDILTAESKKEFDDQKDKMLDEDGSLSESYSDNDLSSDTPPDNTNATKGGVEIKGLTEEQRTKLLIFMDCVEVEAEPSIKYLRGSNWDLEHAIETYFQQHPDHPKSRGGSLQFDLSQLHDIYAEDMDFEADVQLPDVIVHKTKEAPSGQQSDFDVQLDKYRKEVDTLKAELKEQHEDNDRLKVQNEELQIEKDRYAIQSREIQNDWECGQCTFPNVGNAQTCNACLAPRPERNVESTDPQHQRQSTIDAINSAMTESLDALGGDEIKGLTEEQRTQLSMFMGCSESTEVDASIKCLRDANWNPRRALETYFQQHPDPDHVL
eukprot:136124_1